MSLERQRLKLGLLLGVVGGAAVALLVVKRPGSHVWRAVFDAGHVLIAAALVLALEWALATFRPRLSAPRRHVLAVGLTLLSGGGLELAQLVAPGDASLLDFGRDTLGAGAGLALHAGRRALRRWARVTFVLGALGLLAPGLWPAGRALLRKARVVQQLPEVAAFDGPGDAAVFRTLDGGEVAVVPPPSVWREATRGRVGEITFHAGFRNPRLLVDNPFASWAGYQALMISLWSPEDAPFEVVLRIDDEAATLAMDDRFHRRFALVPGPNELRIPLADIRLSPTTRELDLGDLENLVLFMDRPARDHRLFVERLWLE